jgi:photosystem II stability/assembly factor-like uncharacterized protein
VFQYGQHDVVEEAAMATRTDDHILLLAGTRDGLYLYEGTCERRVWRTRGPFLSGCDISHATLDPRDGHTIWVAASGHGVTAVYRSPDRGATWEMAGAPFDAEQVWHVEPGHLSQPGRVYAGVKPAGLFQSDDGGDTWQPVRGLNEHPSAGEWWEGGGGKMLHTILTDASAPEDLTVAISVAGVFHSADGGVNWEPRNEGTVGMASEWEKFADMTAQHHGVHRCVHKVVRHPRQASVLFQQNHDGVFRSDDRGMTWVDICDGLPGRFGFVIGATHDGSVYVVPQDMYKVRYSGQLTVYRLRDGAQHWEALRDGLPEVENITLYREGLATDACTPGGIYFGTSTGDLYASVDGGDHWSLLASGLPPVRSVACEHYAAGSA